MIIANTDALAKAVQKRDYDALRVAPIKRNINRSQHYTSVLMVSAHNLNHLNKIDELNADAIILNLEDGVAKEDKKLALYLCAYFLTQLPQCTKKIIVRVNALDEGGLEEIAFLNAYMPDAIRLPKVRTQNDVARGLNAVNVRSELHLSIETKEAWLNLASLRIDTRVKAFYLGVLDLFAELEIDQALMKVDGALTQYILSHFFMTTKALGVMPISFVYQDYKNLPMFEAWLTLEKSIGYSTKGCISPKQVALCNKHFTLPKEVLIRARYIVEVFEAKQKEGVTGFSDETYGFIDEPIYKGALALIKEKR